MVSDGAILEVTDLAKHYPLRRGLSGAVRRGPHALVRAVDGVSFSVARGEVLALVGESGCGKTTVALTVLGLIEPSAGQVRFEGRPLHAELRRDRGLRQKVQMVFQDPYASLNPRMPVAEIVAEPLEVHRLGAGRAGRHELVRAALEEVGLRPAEEFLGRLPHELSGGQRQRVVIAAALVTSPRLLVADEPVSMLDVSIRAEILALLNELRRRRGISILFITHDLATAALFADRVAVMYLGRIVEIGPTAAVMEAPRHPYTRALLSVVPSLSRRGRERIILQGETPDPAAIPAGCRFHPRCPLADAGCRTVDPALEPRGGQLVACVKA
ncbi:MAG: ABC transporter ATP-binding protein [Chloroflexales bacterium]|nr:ABC transporter ATP-binding protein [Chloroflexales bacterium]